MNEETFLKRWWGEVERWRSDVEATQEMHRRRIERASSMFHRWDEAARRDEEGVLELAIGPGTRVWIGDAEVTDYIRTGDSPLRVEGDRVVFARSGRDWRPR